MKIVIVGGGSVGFAAASELTAEGHDITIVDANRDKLETMSAMLDVMTVAGNGAALDVQRLAGVADCDLLIAVTSSDETNILSCILARKLGCKNTIARVRNPEYTEEMYLLRKELGLSMTVNPDHSAAQEAFRLLQYPDILKHEVFVKSRAELVTIRLEEGNPLCGQKLMELPRVLRQRIIVCAVRREGKTVIPGGTFELCRGDEIVVTAPSSELSRLMETMGLRAKKARNVMILGGSRMAALLADMLVRAGTRVKILERDPKVCEELAERLPDVSVFCEDGTSQDALKSQNVSQMDAVVALLELDEENVFVSMYAAMMGVPQTVSKINRQEFIEVCRKCGIDRIVTPKKTCAREVSRYVRAMQNMTEDSILSVYSLSDGAAEALEFEVAEDLPHLGVPLSELSLKKNILLCCITRERQVIFPGGSDCLQKGDTVIVVTADTGRIMDLRDIFAAG